MLLPGCCLDGRILALDKLPAWQELHTGKAMLAARSLPRGETEAGRRAPSSCHVSLTPLLRKHHIMLVGKGKTKGSSSFLDKRQRRVNWDGEAINFFKSLLAIPQGMWDLSSMTRCPLHWQCRVLTTGPPEKSLIN